MTAAVETDDPPVDVATPIEEGQLNEPPIEITDPGLYQLSDEQYHADPVPGRSLSSSGARRLLPPSCPAIFRHEQLNGRASRPAFDFGHAAHALVLGVGAPLVVVEHDDWRTKAAKEQRDEAYAAGHTPILAKEHEQVVAMAEQLRAHPIVGGLFLPDQGDAEQSLFWRDEVTDVWLRARLDWIRKPSRAGGRTIVVDYKTSVSAEPGSFAKSIANYGYYMQADWYLGAVRTLELAEDDAAFVFVTQEKTPPYLVTVFELDSTALHIGHLRNRQAIELYAECLATDTWPSYSDDVELVTLPSWFTRQYEGQL